MTIKAVFFDMGGTLQTFTYDQQLRLNSNPRVSNRLIKMPASICIWILSNYLKSSLRDCRNHARRLETLEEWSSLPCVE